MSTEEERTVVSDVENAKISDETSTAGEHREQKQSEVESEIPTDEIKAKEEGETIDAKTKVIDSSKDEINHEKPNEELTIFYSMASSNSLIQIQDEEANASFLLGKRDVLLNNYQSACDHLSKTCERIVKLRQSDTIPELAEPYFYYGQALLYLGLSEQQVFGSDIVKDGDNDENDVIVEEEEDGEGEGDDAIPDDENVNDLERAFEILECAHMIYSKLLETNLQDSFILIRIADIHVMLADICNENGDHQNALSHVLKAIEIQDTINEQQRYRLLAESYYKLGLIYELINKFPDAADSFHRAIDAIHQAIKQSQGEDKENEREELKSLLPSIELKLNDAKASIADQHLIAQAGKILTATTAESKTSDLPAKDITLNIRHKRPMSDIDENSNKKSN